MRFIFAFVALLSVAFAQKWQATQMSDTVLMGVSFPSHDVGFLVASPASGGAFIYKTENAGSTWDQIKDGNNSIFLFDIEMGSNTHGIASGLSVLEAADQYTVDGNDFVTADDKYLQEECQSATMIRGTPNSYMLTGQFGPAVGVAVTNDGGKTYTHINAGLPAGIPARYGAAPSDQLYIITGGTWPNNDTAHLNHQLPKKDGAVDQWLYSASRRLHYPMYMMAGGEVVMGKPMRGLVEELFDAPAPPVYNWVAVIQVSKDAGKTWQQTYYNTTFYFNDIHCPTTHTCFAVGEDDNDAFILTSIDGGMTWVTLETLNNASLMAVMCLNDMECWVGGGSNVGGHGIALHTINGGKDWTNEALDGFYYVDFSFVSRTDGWAAALSTDGNSYVLHYY